MFKDAASCTEFPCKSGFSFGKDYFLPHGVFKVVIGSLCSKQAYSSELKKHTYPNKENFCVRSRNVQSIVPL
jgi:hypothetical protein